MFIVYTSHNTKKENSSSIISDVVSMNNPINIFYKKLKNRAKIYLKRVKVFFFKNAYYCTKLLRLTFVMLKYSIPNRTQILINKESVYQTILSVFNMKYFIQNTEIHLRDLKKCFKKSNTFLSNYETITVIGK